jgi:hypothetical protein
MELVLCACVCIGGASGKTSAIDAWGEGGEGVEGGEREWLKRREGVTFRGAASAGEVSEQI